jgi:hypothetical protein
MTSAGALADARLPIAAAGSTAVAAKADTAAPPMYLRKSRLDVACLNTAISPGLQAKHIVRSSYKPGILCLTHRRKQQKLITIN